MQRIFIALSLGALVVAADSAAQAANPGDEVLAENASVKLTRADYEADLLRIPADKRAEFAASPMRLTVMLNKLLVDKSLAKEARDAGLDREPETARRLALEIDRFLAQALLAKIEADAAAEFDAQEARFIATARETYLMDKERYRMPEEVSASHILFDPAKHGGSDAALALAKEARAKIIAGADFSRVAAELSDDPGSKTHGGQVGWFGPKKMDPAFSKAAFGLAKVGDLSEPVQTSFGWHIIRLDGRKAAQDRTFDQVKSEILAELKRRYVAEKRNAKVAAITQDPSMKVNQQAVEALLVKVPDNPRVLGTKPPSMQ